MIPNRKVRVRDLKPTLWRKSNPSYPPWLILTLSTLPVTLTVILRALL